VNAEIAKIKQGDRCSVCAKDDLKLGRASEVGNVFDLGQKYGKDFDLGFINQMGDKQFPFMGCYGIGVSRVMGVIVEKLHDDKGIMWPESVAPFKVHLIALGKETETYQEAEKLYQQLIQQHVEVLYDDRRETSAGEKFADADLIGIPYRLVMSKKTLVEQAVEVKKRAEAKVELISCDKILSYVK
jgi:prolyl-tRNA synthetase